jgi:hypothetical protein
MMNGDSPTQKLEWFLWSIISRVPTKPNIDVVLELRKRERRRRNGLLYKASLNGDSCHCFQDSCVRNGADKFYPHETHFNP